jgi:drug/metabolite transporter (DMT)-like permease
MWLGLAGLLVAIAIASQWSSYDLIAIAVAITLMQLSAPVVIATAPLIVGTHMERVTPPVIIGTALIMAGSILVILA